MAKSCPDGQYYCNTHQECRPIPNGTKVLKDGKLVKELFVNLPLHIETPQNQTEFDMGLMFRESLQQDSGMLFVFESIGEKFFHMKNTMIPLDVAFINEEGVIKSIKQLEPLNTLPVSSEDEVLYALEVNRNWFTEHNINVGDTVLEPSTEKVVTIENSDGKKFADITDIIGPSNMEPVIQNGIWKGTRQVMAEQKSFSEFIKESKN